MARTKVPGLTGLMRYMEERENIRLRREQDQPWPWTNDPILQKYKFTNVHRAHDRATQEFKAHYTRHTSRSTPWETVLYNCGVARYFGSVPFVLDVGWQTHHEPKRLARMATAALARKEQVYSGAYMITTGGQSRPKAEVIAERLGTLWDEAPAVIDALSTTQRWEAAYNVMHQLDGYGASGFMAKEILQDFLMMWRTDVVDRNTWTPMGMGARRGMNRLAGRPVNFRQPEAQYIAEVQVLHHRLSAVWYDSADRAVTLTAHDVQFCLCEFDKYERVRLHQGKPRSLYHRPAES